MNKVELAKRLAVKMSTTQCYSIHFLSALQEILADELQQNGTIMLQGFGCFSPWEQTERAGRNPRTGTPCMIRKRTSVKFKPGKDLLELLNTEK